MAEMDKNLKKRIQVTRLIEQGLTNVQIASKVKTSEKFLNRQRKRIKNGWTIDKAIKIHNKRLNKPRPKSTPHYKTDRPTLEKMVGRTEKFSAVFQRRGTVGYLYQSPTVLLSNVKDEDGKIVCDHVWVDRTDEFFSAGMLEEGDVLTFQADVEFYVKGYTEDCKRLSVGLTNLIEIEKE